LVDTVCKEKRVSLVIKDVSWLWRTAYNCAAQGCTEWDNAEERVPPLFDVSREVRLVLYPGVTLCSKGAGAQLLEIYLETALEVNEEMHLCLVFSSFAAASARGMFQSNFLQLLRPSDADC
jgi:hypothetical protein